MHWLQKQDFRVPASRGGFFAWNRFHRGFLPEISEHPRKWVELCAESEGPSEAWKWDLKASIFAGEWAHAELPGASFRCVTNVGLLKTANGPLSRRD